MPVDTYRSQKRGGRGISAQSLKDEDYVKSLFIASTHDYLLFFTNRGRVHRRKGYQIPEASRTARGTAIVNILPLEQDEKVTAMVLTRTFDDNECLMMVTRNGTVKRLRLDAINTARKAGIRALTLDEGDELIAVLKTDGHQNILIATRNGMAICFDENDVRPMGRDAAGVRGIRLDDGDYVVGATLADTSKCLLTVTEKGYGKRTAVDEYLRGGENDDTRQPQKRGGKGLKNYNLTEKTGKVAGVCLVSDDQDVMLIADDGTIIRMAASDINTYSRVAQGVIVMRPDEGSHVIAVETTDREEEPTETGETTEA
jgi:DNA gyrase subunit A